MKATHILFPILAFFAFSMILFGNSTARSETDSLVLEGSSRSYCEEVDISVKLELLDLFLEREDKSYFNNLLDCGVEATIGLDCKCIWGTNTVYCQSSKLDNFELDSVNNLSGQIKSLIKRHGYDNLFSKDRGRDEDMNRD